VRSLRRGILVAMMSSKNENENAERSAGG
jgi:hypothetical protein